ncbi:hypothetical protein FACS1894174_07510 [Bacteroidia bacterium]|nr:hypothetical protein FACS1894155_10240 [Bacteroidia bacterium]GHV22631.1 hypothetical protein FACS1894174_07510 [Bacteroidia bacterium]
MKKLVLFATIFAAVAFTACTSQKKEEAAPAAETEQVETPAPATQEEAAPADSTTTEAPAETPAQ